MEERLNSTPPDYAPVDPIELIPDGAVPEAEIRVLTYIDDEGDAAYCFALTEGSSITHIIGVLAMVQAHLSHASIIRDLQEHEEDDD